MSKLEEILLPARSSIHYDIIFQKKNNESRKVWEAETLKSCILPRVSTCWELGAARLNQTNFYINVEIERKWSQYHRHDGQERLDDLGGLFWP